MQFSPILTSRVDQAILGSIWPSRYVAQLCLVAFKTPRFSLCYYPQISPLFGYTLMCVCIAASPEVLLKWMLSPEREMGAYPLVLNISTQWPDGRDLYPNPVERRLLIFWAMPQADFCMLDQHLAHHLTRVISLELSDGGKFLILFKSALA